MTEINIVVDVTNATKLKIEKGLAWCNRYLKDINVSDYDEAIPYLCVNYPSEIIEEIVTTLMTDFNKVYGRLSFIPAHRLTNVSKYHDLINKPITDKFLYYRIDVVFQIREQLLLALLTK